MAIDPNRVKDLFLAAAELPDAGARAEYLDRECGPDTDLRGRVEALLRAHDEPGSFVGHPADPAATRTLDRDAGGTTAVVPPTDDVEEALGFLAPAGRPDSLGRIGHYEVLEVLGRGAFGIVFRAFDDNLQRVVAVKVLAPQMAATSPARKRFTREARSAAAVRHENVVQVYDVQDQPLPYLAMEYIPGATLQQRLDQTGPLDVTEVLRIGRQIADGLSAAHAQDLIHRDVKPGNILIESGPQHRVKLTDFGLARAADDASISQSGVVAGTPMYMAPEQAKGEALDHRADLFSLGSVLYVMASGRPPFRAAGTLAVLKRVAEDDPRPIREIIPEVPEWLCRIIAKLHAKNPADRFQTAAEVADVLADCEQQIQAHGAVRDFSRIPGGTPRSARSRLTRVFVAASALVILATIIGIFASEGAIYRYLTNRSEIRLNPLADPDVVEMRILRDGEVVATIGATVPGNVQLSPGEYEVEAVCVEGYEATKYDIDVSRFGAVASTFERSDDGGPVRLVVRRGEVAVVSVTAERRPDPRTAPGPWVQLFNGKDLTGWKKHPRLGGFWHVDEAGVLIATGPVDQSYLATERGDFENFHLRMEVQIDDPLSDSGVFLRVPFPEFKDFAEVNIGFDPKRPLEQTGTVLINHAGAIQHRSAAKGLAGAGRWFTLDIIVQGDEVRTLVEGKPGVTTTLPPGRRRGHILLQQAGDKAAVRFRKIDIKELPASSPEVPGRAADVLAFIRGDWKREAVVVEPKLPPERARSSGHLTFESVAGGTVMRGLSVDEAGNPTSLILHSYHAGSDRIHSWSFSADGEASSSEVGAYDSAKHSFWWQARLPDGTQSDQHMDFVDGKTVQSRYYETDAVSAVVAVVRLTFTRTSDPAPAPNLRVDPKRPREMAVLDRLVGDWRTKLTVNPAAPAAPKAETSNMRAVSILGGRFIEVFETNETTRSDDYAVVWYDADRKQYRQWFFQGAGHAVEFSGTWDEATKAMTWTSADKRLDGEWVFSGDDVREFRHRIKDAAGKTASEAVRVSRRASWRPLFNGKDLTGWHAVGDGTWTVGGGVLTGTGVGHLYTRGEYADFHLRAEVRVGDGGDSGLLFRCDNKHLVARDPVAFEAMINPTNQQSPRTGSLMDPTAGFQYGKDPAVPPDTWFTYEVVAVGDRITLRVNGRTTLEGRYGNPKWPAGPLGLQLPGAGKTVAFRKIEVMELPPTGAGAGKTDKP